MIISQSIDLAGLAHRERSLTLQCFLTWNSVQSDKIYPSYLFYFRHKKRAASHPQLGLAQHFFPQGHKLLRLKRDWKALLALNLPSYIKLHLIVFKMPDIMSAKFCTESLVWVSERWLMVRVSVLKRVFTKAYIGLGWSVVLHCHCGLVHHGRF